MKRVLALTLAAVLVPAGAWADEEELEGAKWAPFKGGPTLGISAAQSLRQLPLELGEPLRLDLPEERAAVPQRRLDRLGRGGAGGQAAVHRAGGRLVAEPAGPVARGSVISTEHQAAEPTMGVTSDGTLFYAATGGQRTVLLRSRDGGKSWVELDPLVPGTHTDEVSFDPFMYVDGRTDTLYNAELTLPTCAGISVSHDGGETFSGSPNCNHADHQNLFAGKDVVYYCSTDGGATLEATGTGCSKSTDDGLTWARTGTLPFVNDPSRTGGSFGIPGFCSGATGHGTVGPDGTVYLPRGWCDQPYVAISSDQGASWTRVQVADKGVITGIEDEVIGSSAGFAVEDHEAAIALDAGGNAYYFWIGIDHLPYLVVSRDGGKTWGKAIMVAAPGVNEAWGPSIDAGATGHVAFSYMGTTNSPGGPYCARTTGTTTCETADGGEPVAAAAYEHTTWNGYIGMTADALAPDPVFQSAPVNDPADPLVGGVGCGPVRCLAELDFIKVAIAPDGSAYSSFVDGCEGPDACSASGLGIVGHLEGGSPLVPPTLPNSTPPAAKAPKACTRAARIRVRARRVTVNGKRLRVRRGRAVIDLRRYRGRTVRVKLVTRRGKRVVRRYRVCRAKPTGA